MLRPAALLLILVFFLSSGAQAQEDFEIPAVTIAGGQLTESVHLAPADADAFRRRLNLLPRLDEEPEARGEPYTVTSSYWSSAVRLEDDEDRLDVGVKADYYPDGGFVRVPINDEYIWSVINLRQRMILDRYIHAAEAGDIGDTPSTLDVLAAHAGTPDSFGLSAGSEPVEYSKAVELVTTLSTLNPEPFLDPRLRPEGTEGSFWLVATLPEGRSLRYFFDGTTLTESLGTERYDASGVLDLLTSMAPAAVPEIVHNEPAGARLWWGAAAGGAAVAIAIAVWLARRNGLPIR